MTEFNWDDYAKHVDALREMGCAVVTITPEDAENVFEDKLRADEAHTWLKFNHDEVEGAILGDYWGDSIRDIYDWKSKND